MPAEVEGMIYVGQTPWHGLGKRLEVECTSEEAIVAAGLDWEVETARIATNDMKHTAIEDYRVTRRVVDDAILGIVNPYWKPIQNRAAFKFFDSIVGEGIACYHTAGSLRGGSIVFMLAKLPGVLEVGKGIGKTDDVDRYLLLANYHYGSTPMTMLFTPVRVVCANTLALAIRNKGEDGEWHKNAPRVTIHHTVNAAKHMREAQRVMKSALSYYEKFGEFANYLYGKQLSSEQVTEIIATVFPPNKKKEVTPAIDLHRTSVERLFIEGAGHNAIAGSAWALLNAFTQYADHEFSRRKKGSTPDSHGYSVLFGGAKGLKQRATKVLTEACAA